MDAPASQPFPQLPSFPLPYPPPLLPSDHSMSFRILISMSAIPLIIFLLLVCACITRIFRIENNDHEPAADTHHHHRLRSHHTERICEFMQKFKGVMMEASDGFVYDKTKSIIGDEGGEKSSSTTECAICLEDFKDGDVCRALHECDHVFHKECVVSWLMQNNTCPMCRAVTAVCVSKLPV